MIQLYRSEDDTPIGSITEEALDFLITHFEEEDSEDTDYYVDRDTLDFLKDRNPPAGLIQALEAALAGREDLEFYYLSEDLEQSEEEATGTAAEV